MVTTRKIAERVSGEETSCETAVSGAEGGALMGSVAIEIRPDTAGEKKRPLVKSVQGDQRNRQMTKPPRLPSTGVTMLATVSTQFQSAAASDMIFA
jgi:hypothetical protein